MQSLTCQYCGDLCDKEDLDALTNHIPDEAWELPGCMTVCNRCDRAVPWKDVYVIEAKGKDMPEHVCVLCEDGPVAN